jgi:hypothetical protein
MMPLSRRLHFRASAAIFASAAALLTWPVVSSACGQRSAAALDRGPAIPQAQPAPDPVFCGIRLSNPAAALLREVETKFDKPIKERVGAKLPPGTLAVSGLDPLGVPYISVSESASVDEAMIVHELFHLKLLSTGFPVRLIWGARGLPHDDGRYARWGDLLFTGIMGPMLHRVFYPKMRAMGLNPTALQEKAALNIALENMNNKIDWPPDRRVLTYFFFAVELKDDPQMLGPLRTVYFQQGWTTELAKAKRMAEIAIDAELETGDKLVDAFVRCANVFLEGRVAVEFLGWMPFKSGSSSSRTAALALKAPADCKGSLCKEPLPANPSQSKELSPAIVW